MRCCFPNEDTAAFIKASHKYTHNTEHAKTSRTSNTQDNGHFSIVFREGRRFFKKINKINKEFIIKNKRK